MAVTQQEGAPYPADMGHLDQILAIGDGHSLPEDAQVSSVAPATNFAKEFPGGWGYIISFTASDAAIRKYVTKYSYAPASHIEEYPTVESERGGWRTWILTISPARGLQPLGMQPSFWSAL